MRSKQSCGECTRRKIRCDRGSPCSNCTKFNAYCFYVTKEVKLDYKLTELAKGTLTENNFNLNLITVNENGRGDKIDLNGLSRYRFNKYLKLERRLASLNYTLNKLVNQSFVDPKIEMLMNGFDFELYESTMGMKLVKKALKSKTNHVLYNPNQSKNMNELISELVSMYFEYCTLCTVSINTIVDCYERLGLNSYLVNCICACMMPQYLMLRGRSEGLELRDNIFYLRALFLFKSNSTAKMEIVWGTTTLLLLELQYGSLFNAFVHLGKLTATCFEMRLHCLDEHHSQSPKADTSIESIEMRSGWWGCLASESVASLLFLRPINLIPDPKQTQIPNPHINFSPSPHHQFDDYYPEPYTYNVVDGIYQTDSQLNGMSKLTCMAVYLGHAFNSYLKFYSNIPDQIEIYQNLKFKFFSLLNTIGGHFSLEHYMQGVKTNPDFYATTAQLTGCVTFHGIQIICHLIESKLDKEFNQLNISNENMVKAKVHSNKLLQFIKSTLQLPNCPPPELDLTAYYSSSQIIPIILLQLTKAFIPVKSSEDLDSLQLLASIIQKYSILSQHYTIYFDWCQHIIKHNGYFSLNKINKNEDLVIGLLRESW